MLKKAISALLLTLALSLLIGPDNTAAASEDEELKVTNQQMDNFINEYAEYGVDENTANQLLEKVLNGQAIDSMVMDEDQAIERKVITNEKEKIFEEVLTFPDGSITVIGVEHDINEISPLSTGIGGGSCSSGSGYSNCKNKRVYYNTLGLYQLSFYADYSIVNKGYDSIGRIYNSSISGLGTINQQSFRIIKKKENSSGRAEARLSVRMNISGTTHNRSLSLLVGSNKATARGNTFY